MFQTYRFFQLSFRSTLKSMRLFFPGEMDDAFRDTQKKQTVVHLCYQISGQLERALSLEAGRSPGSGSILSLSCRAIYLSRYIIVDRLSDRLDRFRVFESSA